MFNNNVKVLTNKLFMFIDKIFEWIIFIINESDNKEQMLDSLENYRKELKESLKFNL